MAVGNGQRSRLGDGRIQGLGRARRHARSWRCASELQIDLDRFVDGRPPAFWAFLEGCVPWSFLGEAQHEFRGVACPVCHDAVLRPSEYCSACDRSGLDGRVTFPGLPVDSAPVSDWVAGDGLDGRRLVATMRQRLAALEGGEVNGTVATATTRRARRALVARARAAGVHGNGQANGHVG